MSDLLAIVLDNEVKTIPPRGKYVNVGKFSQLEIPNNTSVYDDLYTLPSDGLLIGTYYVEFPSNATGSRTVRFAGRAGTSGNGLGTNMPANPNGATRITIPLVFHGKQGDDVRGQMVQFSGTTLTITFPRYFFGYFIPD